MRFLAILLIVLVAGFGWALWQGIDLAASWLEDAAEPGPDRLILDEVEFITTDAEPALLEPDLENEEITEATPTHAPETAGAISPLEPSRSSVVVDPIEADRTLKVPTHDTAQPEPTREGATEPASPALTTPELGSQSEVAAVAVGPAALEPAPLEPAATPQDAEAEVPAIPEPEAELTASEPTAREVPADESAQPVQAEAPQCNVQRCAEAYRSFRASDCTYQPFEGPRQLCVEEPRATEPLDAEAATQPVQAEAPQCNVQRCAEAYRSFRASDCTYQPFEGPRQLCVY